MFRKIFIILIAGALLLGISQLSFAMMCGGEMHLAQAEHPHTEESAVSEKPVDVGNKICPVSGEKIKADEKFTVEHEGKIYNLCCKMCIKDFKKDPQKYIEKLEKLEGKESEHPGQEGHEHHREEHH